MHAFIGGMGYGEMLLVFFIAMLLFGKRLPELWHPSPRRRRLQRHEQYEAEKQAEEFAQKMDRFGRAVALVIIVVSVAVILASLFRDFGLF